jgi:TetR/AcrR family transcriptional regulator, repressor for uid operon
MPRRRPTIGLAPLVAGMAADPDADGEMLDAAEALLADYGLRRWSMDDVADRAGVGRTSVYRAFESRDALVHAVLARELRRTFAAIEAVAALHDDLEDKVVEAGLVALAALRGSIVERLLHSDPATFLPFLTTGAGPLLAIARAHLLAGAHALGLDLDPVVAEVAARLGLSFILTRDTAIPVDDEARTRATLRRLVRPLLAALPA